MSPRIIAVATFVCGLATAASFRPAAAQLAPATPVPAPTPTASAPAAPATGPAAATTPAPASTKLLQFSGYAAAAYEHFASEASGSTPALRVFDVHPDTFDLQAVNVKAQVNLPAGFGLTAESVFGTDADGLAANGTSRVDGFDLPQAYVSYAHGPFTAIVGRFATLAGAEVFEDPSDYEFSRSILYGFAEPFTHTGARLTYGFDGGKFTANAGVNNGWDDIKFIGKKKTFEFGTAITISPAFTFNATTYNGQDFTSLYQGAGITNDPAFPDVGQRSLYDFVLTTKATSALTLVSNYDNGNQQNTVVTGAFGEGQQPVYGSSHWVGFSQIADYQFNSKIGLALRGEVYHDGGGYHTGQDQYLREGTATLAYTPTTPLLFRLEYRVDGSNMPYFPTSLGDRSPLNHQNSFAIESAVKF